MSNSNDFITWYKSHNPQWISRFPTLDQDINPDSFLGQEDALNEWSHSTSEDTFAQTLSYTDFKKVNSLFLFGRRGTGKTSIIQMLNYEINHTPYNGYSSAAIFIPTDFIPELTSQISGSFLNHQTEKELIQFCQKVWFWVIKTRLIIHFFSLEKIEPSACLEYLSNLDAVDLNDDLEISEYIKDIFIERVLQPLSNLSSREKIGITRTLIYSSLETDLFKELSKEVDQLMQEERDPTLLLVDTDEVYILNDTVSNCVRTGLMDCCLKIYNSFLKNKKLLLKVAFPSEIIPHLRPTNKEKTVGKDVMILWNYKDLNTFLAKRLNKALNEINNRKATPEKIKDYKTAREYLLRYFPEEITTRNGLTFDTISYLIRHTQKKPRQLIALFNSLHKYAEKKDVKISDLKERPEIIIDGIHSRLDLLVEGSLDIYNDIYSNASKIIKKCLTKARNYFSYSDLDKLLHSVNDIKNSLSKDDIRRLLLESGVLGICHEANKIDNDSTLIESVFEYQIKDVLELNNSSFCVIHPMYYDELRSQIDTRVFIYPIPSEKEENEILETIKAS